MRWDSSAGYSVQYPSPLFFLTSVLALWNAGIVVGGAADSPPPATKPASQATESPGRALFQSTCAACHSSGTGGAPPQVALSMMGGAAIYTSLTTGRMRGQAAGLSDQERRHIAEYLGGKGLNERPSPAPKACETNVDWFDRSRHPVGDGWGIDAENTRLIPAAQAGLSRADLPHLTLKWAFAFPDVSTAIAQPTVAGGGLFVGSANGTVYALDANSGCMHWTFKARAAILGSVVIRPAKTGSPALFFADRLAYAYAVDATTGTLLWESRTDDHPSATIMGTPALMQDRLFVPIISFEENAGGPEYPCCTFRGSLVALEAETGKMIWKSYVIPSPAIEQSKNELGVPQFAPAGSGLWSAPTIDTKRRLIYFTTGNSYSEPADESSNAVFAVDLLSGQVKWHTQTLGEDNFTTWDYVCRRDPKKKLLPGCPIFKKPGPDLDFTASPVLVRGRKGKDVVVAGRKDGTTFGFDPDRGAILWSSRTSRNPDPNAGALYFGLMAEGSTVFVPSAGTTFPGSGALTPTDDDGLFALDAFTGKRLWAAKTAADCERQKACTGITFAPIGFPGVVFAGDTNGYIRAYDSMTGQVLWRFDTAKEFVTLNGETAKGGAISRNSIMIGNGMLYVGSGANTLRGNTLLAFSVERKR